MTDEQIIKIAETLGEWIPGRCNYDSWGHGYREDENGEPTIPNVRPIVLKFARALLSALPTPAPTMVDERGEAQLPLLNDDRLIAAAMAAADAPLDHIHIGRYLPKWRSFVRKLAEQEQSTTVEAEQFLDAGLADVQDEGGVATYYSRSAVLECIDAALEHVACEKVIAAQKRSDGIEVSGLPPATIDLVRRFSRALAEKLAGAEKKYGYSDGWLRDDWMDECRTKLLEHVKKGDPRDVAAYCAFLWHHGESTNEPLPISRAEWMAEAKKAYIEAGDDEAIATEMSRYLCDQQDWLGEDIGEPRAEVQEELRGRQSPLRQKTALDFFADEVEASGDATRPTLQSLGGDAGADKDLIERLKMEARIHAQEARTANSTIAEIYRIVSGATGEPGNWNGAEPVRRCIESLRSQVAVLSLTSTEKSEGGAPEGWQLVPKEPTAKMMDAAWDHTPLNMDDMTDGDFGQAYKDMLAAAPKAAEKSGRSE